MICPVCKFEGLRPFRTFGRRREYLCFCGHRFTTTELLAEDAQRQSLEASLYRVLAKDAPGRNGNGQPAGGQQARAAAFLKELGYRVVSPEEIEARRALTRKKAGISGGE